MDSRRGLANGWALVHTTLGWYVERDGARHWLCVASRTREYAGGLAGEWARRHA